VSFAPVEVSLDAIERLFALLHRGAISQAEFDELKATVLEEGKGAGGSGQYLWARRKRLGTR